MVYEWATDRPFSLPGAMLGRYLPVIPGDAAFVCRADECGAWCCRALSVPVDDRDAQRMERHSGLARPCFLECEEGRPIELPLAEPYLLARREGQCALLGGDLRCNEYEGRPNACRAYPFQLVLLSGESGRPIGAGASSSVRERARPVLLRHLDCPGFTGPAIDEHEWQRLVAETASLGTGGAAVP